MKDEITGEEGTAITPLMIAAMLHSKSFGSLEGLKFETVRGYFSQSFIAGADWMALQIKERPIDYGLMTVEHHEFVAADMVERATRGGVHPANLIGWDLAAPGSDYTAKTVAMTDLAWEAYQAELASVKDANRKLNGEREKLRAEIAIANDRIEARGKNIAALNETVAHLEAYNKKLKAERDTWQDTATEYAQQLHAARHEAARLVPRGPFPPAGVDQIEQAFSRASYGDLSAEMQAHLDASIFGTGVIYTDENGNKTAIDPREYFGRSLTDHLVKEAGGTGGDMPDIMLRNGPTDRPGIHPDHGKAEHGPIDPAEPTYDLRKTESLLRFWKNMAEARRKANGLIGDMLTEALDLLEDK